jgi:hypothetical protein
VWTSLGKWIMEAYCLPCGLERHDRRECGAVYWL